MALSRYGSNDRFGLIPLSRYGSNDEFGLMALSRYSSNDEFGLMALSPKLIQLLTKYFFRFSTSSE
jgi:hypothetical protein